MGRREKPLLARPGKKSQLHTGLFPNLGSDVGLVSNKPKALPISHRKMEDPIRSRAEVRLAGSPRKKHEGPKKESGFMGLLGDVSQARARRTAI